MSSACIDMLKSLGVTLLPWPSDCMSMMMCTRMSSDDPVRRPCEFTSRETSTRASSTSKLNPPSSMLKKIVPKRWLSPGGLIDSSSAGAGGGVVRRSPPHHARRLLRELQGAVALVSGRRRELHDHDVRHHHRVRTVVGDGHAALCRTVGDVGVWIPRIEELEAGDASLKLEIREHVRALGLVREPGDRNLVQHLVREHRLPDLHQHVLRHARFIARIDPRADALNLVTAGGHAGCRVAGCCNAHACLVWPQVDLPRLNVTGAIGASSHCRSS